MKNLKIVLWVLVLVGITLLSPASHAQNWVEMDSLLYPSAGQFDQGHCAFGLLVYPEFQGGRHYASLFNLSTGHRAWRLPISMPDTTFGFANVVLAIEPDSTVLVVIYQFQTFVQRVSYTGLPIGGTSNIGFVLDNYYPKSEIDDSGRIFVWNNNYQRFFRISRFGEVDLRDSTSDTLFTNYAITPDGVGGAYLYKYNSLDEFTVNHYVTHFLASGGHVGPILLMQTPQQMAYYIGAMTFTTHSRRLFAYENVGDPPIINAIEIQPDTLSLLDRFQVAEANIGGSVFSAAQDSIWRLSAVIEFDSSLTPHWNQTIVSILDTGRVFIAVDTLPYRSSRIFTSPTNLVTRSRSRLFVRRNLVGVAERPAIREQGLSLKAFPNPTNGAIRIDNLKGAGGSWIVYDVLGREVNSGQFATSVKQFAVLIPPSLSTGVYFVSIMEVNQPVRTVSFTVTK